MTHWFVAVVLPSQVFLMLIREGVGGLKENLREDFRREEIYRSQTALSPIASDYFWGIFELLGHFRVSKALSK